MLSIAFSSCSRLGIALHDASICVRWWISVSSLQSTDSKVPTAEYRIGITHYKAATVKYPLLNATAECQLQSIHCRVSVTNFAHNGALVLWWLLDVFSLSIWAYQFIVSFALLL